MMKELNKHILDNALRNLPVYEPGEQLWHNIDLELTAEENDADLQISLSSLPEYSPSDAVWDKIDQRLEHDTAIEKEADLSKSNIASKPPNTRIISMIRWAAAASVVVLLGAFWFWTNVGMSQDSVTISYSEETVPGGFLEVDWETDEDAFALVAEFCKTENIVCQQPDFKIMTEELEELNVAREQLKFAMENYGNDPELIAQLTEIEHVRTDLLKKLVKRI